MADRESITEFIEVVPGEVLSRQPRTDPRFRYFTPDEVESRKEIMKLLENAGMAKEASRFSLCGDQFIVLKCENEEQHDKVRFGFSYCCELRICTRCCQKRGKTLRKEMSEMLKHVPKTQTHKFAFLSVTKKMSEDRLLTTEIFRKFEQNLRSLMNYFFSKEDGCGALAVLEVGKNFNLHGHILVYGPYIPQRALSQKWLEITGDSYIVHIEAVWNQTQAISYLTKYISKPPSFDEPQYYVLYLQAIKGVRRLHRFGILYGFKVFSRAPLVCPLCGSRLRYDGIASLSYAERNCQDYWETLRSVKASEN